MCLCVRVCPCVCVHACSSICVAWPSPWHSFRSQKTTCWSQFSLCTTFLWEQSTLELRWPGLRASTFTSCAILFTLLLQLLISTLMLSQNYWLLIDHYPKIFFPYRDSVRQGCWAFLLSSQNTHHLSDFRLAQILPYSRGTHNAKFRIG